MHFASSIEKINISQWQELINKSSRASFFQTKECYDFYASLSFLKPFIFSVSENNSTVGVVCGYIISEGKGVKSYFSKRAIIPGGILIDEGISEEALKRFLDELVRVLKKEVIYIEIRNYNDYSKFKAVFQKSGFRYQEHLNYQIDFVSNAPAFGKLSESKQRQIKTAQRNGVTCGETKDVNDVKSFYGILRNLYKNKIKLPLFPIEFFEKLIQLPHGKLFVVKYDGMVVGGMACVMLGNEVLYEWFVCGDENTDKKLYPSVMATWEGIKYAEAGGYRCFDFMGAGKPDEDYGVREFKSKFGGNLVEYGRFLYINHPLYYKMGYVFLKLSAFGK